MLANQLALKYGTKFYLLKLIIYVNANYKWALCIKQEFTFNIFKNGIGSFSSVKIKV